MPVDLVLLSMHGAMVSTGCDDCEGDLLSHVRAIAGPEVIVGAELDLHCHITRRMLDNADALITFKEYPHLDSSARAAELFEICLKARQSGVKPVMSVFDCRMISAWRTPMQPMRDFVDGMSALEGQDGVLSVSPEVALVLNPRYSFSRSSWFWLCCMNGR